MSTRHQVILVALLIAPPARAEPDVERAKIYFEAGRQAYEASDYLTAIRSFEEAAAAAPKPFITFALAHGYRRQFIIDRDPGKLKRAVELYRQYLREVPQGERRQDAVNFLAELQPQLDRFEAQQPVAASPSAIAATTQLLVTSQVKGATASVDGGPEVSLPATREVAAGLHRIRVQAAGHFPLDLEALAVEGRLVVVDAPLRERPALVSLRATPGAEVAVDGRTVGVAPLMSPVALRLGRHHVAVTKPGREPFSRIVDLRAGDAVNLDARLRLTGQRKAAHVVLGGAGLLLAAGTVTTVLAVDADSGAAAILAQRDRMNIEPMMLDEYYRLRDRRDTLTTASAALWGGAAALATTGVLLWVLDTRRVEAPPAFEGVIVPSVTPEEIGASYLTRF
jgi:hypothetical protein